jgi:hypothetical protein
MARPNGGPALPRISVLGVYSPKASGERYEQFVRDHVAERDPSNRAEETIAIMKRLGREVNLEPLSDDEKREIEDDLHYHLGEAAYVEVLVRDPDDQFNAGDFVQPDPTQAESFWQAAWNETYLTEDGEAVIAGYPYPEVPDAQVLRVVFVIHFWIPDLPLLSSYGELSCPVIAPLPERLWKLVPYQLPD